MNSGNKGILNNGNTCYLNSVVQSLTHLLFFHPLNKKLKQDYEFDKDKNDLMKWWLQINYMIWDNDSDKSLNILEFIKCFINTAKSEKLYFNNFDQNDCEEFITFLFDMFHKILIKPFDKDIIINNDADKEWYKLYKNDYSLIVEKFYSQTKIDNICNNCNNLLTKYDPLMVLQLPINDNLNNINDALNNYCKEETIDDWNCEKCNKKTKCVNTYKFTRLSDFLIIQLKRYNVRNKNNKFIEYPEYLNLEKIINKEGYIYKLISIIVHSGGLNFGHYYSICYNQLDNKWRCYNDDHVSEIEDKSYLQQNAYCLFYKRIN